MNQSEYPMPQDAATEREIHSLPSGRVGPAKPRSKKSKGVGGFGMGRLRSLVLPALATLAFGAVLVGTGEAKPNKLGPGSTVSSGGGLAVGSGGGAGRPPKVPPPFKSNSSSTDMSQPASQPQLSGPYPGQTRPGLSSKPRPDERPVPPIVNRSQASGPAIGAPTLA